MHANSGGKEEEEEEEAQPSPELRLAGSESRRAEKLRLHLDTLSPPPLLVEPASPEKNRFATGVEAEATDACVGEPT